MVRTFPPRVCVTLDLSFIWSLKAHDSLEIDGDDLGTILLKRTAVRAWAGVADVLVT